MLQTLPPDFTLHMLLFGGWGCQLKRRFPRWSFVFCPHFKDEGRHYGKFLGAQKWLLSKLELALTTHLAFTPPSPPPVLPHFCFPAVSHTSTGLPKSPSHCCQRNNLDLTKADLEEWHLWCTSYKIDPLVQWAKGRRRKKKRIVCKSRFLKDKK